MSDTVKIRYIGPLLDGVWTADGEHGAHDFVHGEYHDVPVGLAVDLLERREPVPPGEPVTDPKTGVRSVPVEPVWELAPGDESKLPAPVKEPKSETPPKAPRARKGGN